MQSVSNGLPLHFINKVSVKVEVLPFCRSMSKGVVKYLQPTRGLLFECSESTIQQFGHQQSVQSFQQAPVAVH